MKKVLLVLVLVCWCVPMATAEEAEPPASADPPAELASDREEVEATVELALTEDGLPLSALDLALAMASAYECPWYTIHCSHDYLVCDDYCGAPGAGDCFRGCCTCLF